MWRRTNNEEGILLSFWVSDGLSSRLYVMCSVEPSEIGSVDLIGQDKTWNRKRLAFVSQLQLGDVAEALLITLRVLSTSSLLWEKWEGNKIHDISYDAETPCIKQFVPYKCLSTMWREGKPDVIFIAGIFTWCTAGAWGVCLQTVWSCMEMNDAKHIRSIESSICTHQICYDKRLC